MDDRPDTPPGHPGSPAAAQPGPDAPGSSTPLAPAPPARGGLSHDLAHLISDDNIAGMGWWLSLNAAERSMWLNRAGSGRPADAWQAYKTHQAAGQDRPDPAPVTRDVT